MPASQFAQTGMTEQAIDNNNESGFLIILLPIAILIIFLFATWPIILFLLLLSVGLNIWQRYQWEKWSKQVDPLFYNLIQLNQGAIKIRVACPGSSRVFSKALAADSAIVSAFSITTTERGAITLRRLRN